MNVKQILWGVVGGIAGIALCRWGGFYLPSTDSFANLRDVPAILLAFFVGPWAALVAGVVAASGRAAIGLFGGVGSATWFASSAATFVAAVAAVAARELVFRGERPSFALGAMIAGCIEMFHMAVVLTVGSAESANAFSVIMAAVPFQCGGAAAIVALASLAFNRRQNGRENLFVSTALLVFLMFVILAYFEMERQAATIASGRIPITDDLSRYQCNLATVIYGIVFSALAFAIAVFVKRPSAESAAREGAEVRERFRVGLRGRFALSLVAMLGVIGGLLGTFISTDLRVQCEEGYAESALFVADLLARYIDGERVVKYRETLEKDDYYEAIRKLLVDVKSVSEIKYIFVMVPDDKGGTYVWGTGSSVDGVPDDLGTREDDFEPDEIRSYGDVFRQIRGRCCFIHRSEAYGSLMSATVPVKGADGAPVALVCVDVSMDYVDRRLNQVVFGVALVTVVIILVCLALYYFFVSRFIVSPAERRIHEEKVRLNAELDVARKIQLEDLPDASTAFPGRRDFVLSALIAPAKAVGGDFYDFFLVDDSHLACVIGDVSDKGVPAALFMMKTRTLLRARTQHGGTPAEICRDVNDILVEGNGSGMFVTVYLVIVDLRTGAAVASNAGHEHPILRRKDGGFELVKYAHDPMLGMMPSLAYTDHAFELHPGDTLLVYTDGVAECANLRRELYGTDRTVAFLNGHRDLPQERLLKALREDLAAFAAGAPQSDDITILALTYDGPGPA